MDNYFCHAPDTFNFALGGSSQPVDFRRLFRNVIRMNGFEFTELLSLLIFQHVISTVLILDRIDDSHYRIYLSFDLSDRNPIFTRVTRQNPLIIR